MQGQVKQEHLCCTELSCLEEKEIFIYFKNGHGHMHRNADWSNGPFHIGCGKLVEKFNQFARTLIKKKCT